MAAVAVAFVATLLAGAAFGVLAAALAWVRDVRPRRFLRAHASALSAAAGAIAAAAVGIAALSVTQADRLQQALVPTCAAVCLLLALATWLLLVEPDDDGGDADDADEPKWWPQFEEELADWSRKTRVPAGPRV